MMRNFLIFIFTAALLSACKKDESKISEDFGYGYYPATKGSYVEYDVEEITYDDFFTPVKIDTFHYQVREVLDSVFEDNELRPSVRITRYRKDLDSSLWQLTDVWYATKTDRLLEVVEENQRYIKLVFPLRPNSRWDGNALNTDETVTYRIAHLNKRETINSLVFNATVRIIKNDEVNLIETRYAEEKYAKGVGLIARKEKFIDTEINGEIKSGYDLTMTILAYGIQ